MGFDHTPCDTGLALGLSLNSSPSMVEPSPMGSTMKPYVTLDHLAKRPIEAMVRFEPSLTLGPSGHYHNTNKKATATVAVAHTVVGEHGRLYRQDSVISGGGSSFSNMSVKREREVGSEESERVSNDNNYNNSRSLEDVEDDDGSVNGRKKLRLTKPQSALLEEAFKLHSSLNPKQKQELARELKLRPRQVEVWFQNRRARTKLKQTEMDYEHLKKCCETLTNENRRLHKEVQEMKALKSSQPFYMQLPAATLTMCPSCESIGDAGSSSGKIPFNMATKPHFFNSFTNPSAAC